MKDKLRRLVSENRKCLMSHQSSTSMERHSGQTISADFIRRANWRMAGILSLQNGSLLVMYGVC